ncbi:MAG: hypothetical protein EZS28_012257 [Streblomastix strix]|uniref:Uncharacterized protein n=1 Tax=Streblomastix strix TaxID=222440 RepID=A0A5J4WBB2_9EUKA|nr:MAG: hypothetical protein EZS28_012257 [Streblomastix strix]
MLEGKELVDESLEIPSSIYDKMRRLQYGHVPCSQQKYWDWVLEMLGGDASVVIVISEGIRTKYARTFDLIFTIHQFKSGFVVLSIIIFEILPFYTAASAF